MQVEQQVEQYTVIDESEIDIRLTEDANRHVQYINGEMVEVVAIARDIHEQVGAQGPMLEDTDFQEDLERSNEQVEDGIYHLAKGQREMARGLKWKWGLFTLGLGIVPGMVAEHRINSQVDQSLRNHENEKVFIPYDQVDNCMHCEAAFKSSGGLLSKGKKKHHCRRCGAVVCVDCLGQKQYMYYKDVEKQRKHNICLKCHGQV
eukprot:TRINITY_DN3173_c0_g1_i2.p1 TRINITY_DN3173_c0_g1~~TRINITY_DN3173_c0_g1_i2.p1  ORF type:complete len:204 (-),score=30.62 TRINITY_DN3173_c0_g1_i2:13-624(-)